MKKIDVRFGALKRRSAAFALVPAAVLATVGTGMQMPTASAETRITLSTLRRANFDRLPTGPISPSSFQKALGGTYNSRAPYDDTSIRAVSGRGNVIRTKLVAGTMHSIPSGNNGATFFLPLPKVVYKKACIAYDIRFSRNFDWSLGGKLPGLEGVAPGVSAATPSGGNDAGDRGWSGRQMWLTPKSYSWAGPVNMGVTYMYSPKMTSTYGDNERFSRSFVAGRWHRIKTCYTMNTVGRADGKLQSWFDGTRVVNKTAYTFRSRTDVGVSHLMWHIFRGGGTSNWAGSRDGYVDIDRVVIKGA